MKTLISLIFLLISSTLMACPSCMGSMDDPKSGNLVMILGGFILLTYIPFYLIYKTIIKNKNFNEVVDEERASE